MNFFSSCIPQCESDGNDISDIITPTCTEESQNNGESANVFVDQCISAFLEKNCYKTENDSDGGKDPMRNQGFGFIESPTSISYPKSEITYITQIISNIIRHSSNYKVHFDARNLEVVQQLLLRDVRLIPLTNNLAVGSNNRLFNPSCLITSTDTHAHEERQVQLNTNVNIVVECQEHRCCSMLLFKHRLMDICQKLNIHIHGTKFSVWLTDAWNFYTLSLSHHIAVFRSNGQETNDYIINHFSLKLMDVISDSASKEFSQNPNPTNVKPSYFLTSQSEDRQKLLRKYHGLYICCRQVSDKITNTSRKYCDQCELCDSIRSSVVALQSDATETELSKCMCVVYHCKRREGTLHESNNHECEDDDNDESEECEHFSKKQKCDGGKKCGIKSVGKARQQQQQHQVDSSSQKRAVVCLNPRARVNKQKFTVPKFSQVKVLSYAYMMSQIGLVTNIFKFFICHKMKNADILLSTVDRVATSCSMKLAGFIWSSIKSSSTSSVSSSPQQSRQQSQLKSPTPELLGESEHQKIITSVIDGGEPPIPPPASLHENVVLVENNSSYDRIYEMNCRVIQILYFTFFSDYLKSYYKEIESIIIDDRMSPSQHGNNNQQASNGFDFMKKNKKVRSDIYGKYDGSLQTKTGEINKVSGILTQKEIVLQKLLLAFSQTSYPNFVYEIALCLTNYVCTCISANPTSKASVNEGDANNGTEGNQSGHSDTPICKLVAMDHGSSGIHIDRVFATTLESIWQILTTCGQSPNMELILCNNKTRKKDNLNEYTRSAFSILHRISTRHS